MSWHGSANLQLLEMLTKRPWSKSLQKANFMLEGVDPSRRAEKIIKMLGLPPLVKSEMTLRW